MSDEVTKTLCIRCPKGCELKIVEEDGYIVVEGNECPLGVEYGKEEAEEPKRMVTSTVEIKNGIYPRLPVRTEEPVPKNKVCDVIDSLKNKVVEAPVKKGDTILERVEGTDADIIAERDMERVKK